MNAAPVDSSSSTADREAARLRERSRSYASCHPSDRVYVGVEGRNAYARFLLCASCDLVDVLNLARDLHAIGGAVTIRLSLYRSTSSLTADSWTWVAPPRRARASSRNRKPAGGK